MATFKPTTGTSPTPQGKKFEGNFKKTMTQNNVILKEIDSSLNENEFSLKKKIFSLAKMEALVFSDPKLSAEYEIMSLEGKNRWGYHWNETVQNILFNDYVLNSPKYLQKYKMAIPKEKKRRDISGINQLKKAGEEKMAQTGLPKAKKTSVDEVNETLTKVQFLVNEKDPENPDLFAYFPEEIHHGEFRTGYSHVGQHSAVHPEYAAESRPATPEEYAGLKAELERQGYNLEVIEPTNETTGAAGGGAGAFTPALGYQKKVVETTTSASSGQYSGPAAWGGGDLMKGGKSKAMRKPIWKGGTIIQESNYLIDTQGFEKYYNELNEQSDVNFIQKNSEAYGSLNNMNQDNKNIIKKDITTGQIDQPNLNTMEESINPDMYNTKEDLKHLAQYTKERTGKGLTKDHIPMLANEALYTIAIQLANKYLSSKGIPVTWDELGDTNSMWDYIDREGNMSYDRLSAAVKEATDERLGNEGFEGMPMDEKATSKSQQRFMGMVHAVQKGELSPDKVGGSVAKAAETMSDSDAEDFASTKHKGLPEKVKEDYEGDDIEADNHPDVLDSENDCVISSNGWKYAVSCGGMFEGNFNEMDDALLHIKQWKKKNNYFPNTWFVSDHGNESLIDDEGNIIKEDTMSMIADKPDSMSNKAAPTGTQSSNMDMGARSTGGGMNESDMRLLEELNNELNAYSIHHNKLKKMSEDRKPSALVLRDRVGSENEVNFKKDLQHSGTKEIIDVEKELQWKDQQTDIGKDPQKLGQDIEKKQIKVTKGEALKNEGDSDNDKGNELIKRNLSNEEQSEVDNYRLGLGDYVYDNAPSKKYETRMEKDMGKKLYKQRQKKLEFRGKQPMYNKDPQPTTPTTADKVQFDKEQTGWNEREGLKESMITGRYFDALNKRRLIDFTLNEVKLVNDAKSIEPLFELDFTGLGNSYNSKSNDNKVSVNEGVVNVISAHKFYTNGKKIFAVKNPVQNLNENEQKGKKPVINEQMNKMKHLLGYKPESFTNTNNVKKNRGF